MHRRLLAGLAAILCVGVAVVSGSASEVDPACGVARAVVTHRPSGGPVEPDSSVTPCVYETGRRAMEPSLGFTSDGRALFQAWELAAGSVGGIPPRPVVLRKDGTTWTDVSPFDGLTHPTSLDPYLTVDRTTGRIFTLDWIAAGAPYCSTISFSDDDAQTWTTSPLGCGGFDGESVATGPPVTSTTIGYPNLVYYCTSGSLGSGDPLTTPTCSKSIDGGLTFLPTGGIPFPATGSQEVFPGWTGTPVVDDDGILYLPKRFEGNPFVAISRDEGMTWQRVRVATNGSAGAATRMAATAGALYYTWIGDDHLPYLARSTDHGSTWSTPLMIAAPDVEEAALARVAVAPGGSVAVAYVGTEDSPGPPFYPFCNPLLGDCDDENYAGVGWNGYLSLIGEPTAVDPVIETTTVNGPEPLFIGGCSADGACKAVLDFIDVQFDPSGDPWAAFVDDCALTRDFTPVFSTQLERCGDGLGEGVVLRLAR